MANNVLLITRTYYRLNEKTKKIEVEYKNEHIADSMIIKPEGCASISFRVTNTGDAGSFFLEDIRLNDIPLEFKAINVNEKIISDFKIIRTP